LIFTIVATDTLTVLDTLTLSPGGDLALNGGVINAKGDIIIANTSVSGGGSATIRISGTADQNLVSNVVAGQGRLPNIVIDKPSGTLFLSGIITARSNWTFVQGNIDATTNNSTVLFFGTKTISGSHILNKVEFGGAATTLEFTIVITDTLTVLDTLTLSPGGDIVLNGGVINAKGDIIIANTSVGGGGSATIRISGTADQNLVSNVAAGRGRLPNIVIDKPSGTLFLSGIVSVRGNWTFVQGNVDATTNNSTVLFFGTKTISGSHILNKVEFGGAATTLTFTIVVIDTLTVLDTLTLSPGGDIALNGGVIDAKGDIIIANTSVGGGGSAIIRISGTADQNLVSNVAAGRGRLPFIVIDKPSGTLFLSGIISVRANWTFVQGNVDATTNNSTVVFIGFTTITGSHTLNNVEFRPVGGATDVTITPATILTVADTLTLGGPSSYLFNGGTIEAQGDILITNIGQNFVGGTATININGTGNQLLTGSGLIFTRVGTGVLPNVIIDKPSGILTLSSIISVGGNFSYIRGTVDAISQNSTVAFFGSFNIDAEGTTEIMKFNNLTLGGETFQIKTLTGDLIVSNILFIRIGRLRLNSNTLTLESNAPGAILTTFNGSIISETTDGKSKVQWNVGNNIGNFRIPFVTNTGAPVFFTLGITAPGTQTGIGDFTVSTFATDNNNLPFPEGVTNLEDLTGADVSLTAVDRYWQIDANNYTTNPTADIIFRYSDAEIGGTNTINEAGLLPFRWNGSEWVVNPVGVVIPTANFVSASSIDVFSPWVLAEFFTPLPGGPFSPIETPAFITGRVINDIDSSCSQNLPGETGVVERMIRAADQDGRFFFVFSDPNGNYRFTVPEGTYTISIIRTDLTQETCNNGAGITFNVTVVERQTIIAGDFFLIPSCAASVTILTDYPCSPGTCPLVPTECCDPSKSFSRINACPGCNTIYRVTFKNNGTDVIRAGADLTITLDPAVTFSSTVSNTCSTIDKDPVIIGNELRWITSDALEVSCEICILTIVGGCTNLSTNVNISGACGPVPPGMPTGNVNQDAVPLVELCECECDPNDKLTRPEGCGPFGNIARGEKITYKIRFQNVGGTPARHVVILDTLDVDLDITTLKILKSSDAITGVQVIPDNVLVITFEDINLPDSLSDPIGSQGFVIFSIQPKGNLPNGTEITNRAGVIFGLNPPVITNTTLNTIRDNPFPVVSFDANRQCAAIDNVFDFTYTGSTSDSAFFFWDFGPDATPSTSTDENPAGIVFSSPGPKEITLTVTRFGCTASLTDTIDVVDVSCGKNANKVQVCHVPPGNPSNAHTICINPNDVGSHIAHGDCVGICIMSASKKGHTTGSDEDGSDEKLLEKDNSGGTSQGDLLQKGYDYQSGTLLSAHPNPFEQTTTINFAISISDHVKLEIYNYTGQRIAVLYNDIVKAWQLNAVEFNTKDLPEGLYYCVMQSGEGQKVVKLSVIR